MKKKIYIVLGCTMVAAGLYVMVSGIIWQASFNILWGVVILGIGAWQVLRTATAK